MTVSKDMIISDLLAMDTGFIPILMGAGMHCLGCPASQGESLEEACAVHGLDADEIVAAMNEYLAAKEQ
jgi:hybrid cluster-associated redox disulfide protein